MFGRGFGMSLGSAGNTNGPALYILEVLKGYTMIFDCDDESDYFQWVAVKGEQQFFGCSPEEVLGLVGIYEALGDDWNQYSAYDKEHIYQRELSDYL